MKPFIFFLSLFASCVLYAAEPDAFSVEGYWQVVTDDPEGIAFVYAKDGVLYCRMVAIYEDKTEKVIETAANPVEKAAGVPGNPPICGLDFIWGLKVDGKNNRYRGIVMDPDSGKQYTCKVWYDTDRKMLVVRGEWFIFGESEYWPAIPLEKVPEGARVNLDTVQPTAPKN